MKEAAESGNLGFVVDPYGAAFFHAEDERTEEALKQLNLMPSHDDGCIVWASTALLSETPSGRKCAEEICEEFIRQNPSIDPGFPGDVMSPFLLGHHKQAAMRARKHAMHVAVSKHWKFRGAALKYLGDEIAEQELANAPSKREVDAAHFHSCVGISKLARGARNEALDHLRKGSDSPIFHATRACWSRAFVACMREDPNCSDWLPNPIGNRSQSATKDSTALVEEDAL